MKKEDSDEKSPSIALYSALLTDIKTRVRQAQVRATLSVNAEMIRMYWDIGKMIEERQEREGWGAGVIPRLARDLHNELPEEKGFSERNLRRMIQFYKEYSGLSQIWPLPVAKLTDREMAPEIRPQAVAQLDSRNNDDKILQLAVAQLPWAHNVILIQKVHSQAHWRGGLRTDPGVAARACFQPAQH
jgi:hypothetical protein